VQVIIDDRALDQRAIEMLATVLVEQNGERTTADSHRARRRPSPIQAEGRVREAGVLTNDKRLKREGKIDQVVGDVKEGAEKVVDTFKDALRGRRK
jgi:uncharacterized protein YjbJ (UPF0337 family)